MGVNLPAALAGHVAAKRRQRAGATLEASLEATCAAYARLTWTGDEYRPRRPSERPAAVIARCHPKTAGIPGKTLTFVKAGWVDFAGYFVHEDRAIPLAFDAKSVRDAARFELEPRQRHQARFLRDWELGGGVAFFFVADTARGVAYAVRAFDALERGEAVPLYEGRDRSRALWARIFLGRDGTLHVPGWDVLALADELVRKAGVGR